MSEEDVRTIFAKNLNRYLSDQQLSQVEVSKLLGISTSTFSSWCTGSKMPRMDKIELLAKYFGIRKSDLIEDHDKSKKEEDGIHELLKDPSLREILIKAGKLNDRNREITLEQIDILAKHQ